MNIFDHLKRDAVIQFADGRIAVIIATGKYGNEGSVFVGFSRLAEPHGNIGGPIPLSVERSASIALGFTKVESIDVVVAQLLCARARLLEIQATECSDPEERKGARMSAEKFPPRVEIRHVNLEGLVFPQSRYPIPDRPGGKTYLSLDEHEALLKQEQARSEKLVEALKRLNWSPIVRGMGAAIRDRAKKDGLDNPDLVTHADRVIAAYRSEAALPKGAESTGEKC